MATASCFGCKEDIKDKMLEALGKSWHPEHFACKECKKRIAENKFHESDGLPVCTKCFESKIQAICAACRKMVTEKVVKAMGKAWHQEHFICGGPCKQQLSGKTFFERNGKPYCTADYERLYAPKCGGCKKPIAEKALSALDSKWHKECFKCKLCKEPIGVDAKFRADKEKQPICEKCGV
ncbi:transforming growth factor beta-1-induced transcript 1 protein-like [Anopheles albimanus]|uniref:transforming growth factor beta-1-induced transcript 1 protein-like n=1 Tax=Anopheles albimanus TaxID=7167 RepID=UPI00163E70F8|nr:transforming growth factor beta-1-induced transcript 1 protein-like [Anopheles albimanus]